jgi:hypothetical protein
MVLFEDYFLNVIHKKDLHRVDNSEGKNASTDTAEKREAIFAEGIREMAKRPESVVSGGNLINAEGHYRNAGKCHR